MNSYFNVFKCSKFQVKIKEKGVFCKTVKDLQKHILIIHGIFHIVSDRATEGEQSDKQMYNDLMAEGCIKLLCVRIRGGTRIDFSL